MSTFTIRTNLPDFHRQILELRADLQGKSLRGAASAAANVLAKSVRDQIGAKGLVRTGVMQRSVYVSRTRRPTGPGVARYFVSIRQGKKAKTVKRGKMKGAVLDAYYWRWVEAGHLVRGPGQAIKGGDRYKNLQRQRLRTSGASKVDGKWFVRDGFNAAKGRAVDVFYERMAKALIKYKTAA